MLERAVFDLFFFFFGGGESGSAVLGQERSVLAAVGVGDGCRSRRGHEVEGRAREGKDKVVVGWAITKGRMRWCWTR